jgi:hypothetical protein
MAYCFLFFSAKKTVPKEPEPIGLIILNPRKKEGNVLGKAFIFDK